MLNIKTYWLYLKEGEKEWDQFGYKANYKDNGNELVDL